MGSSVSKERTSCAKDKNSASFLAILSDRISITQTAKRKKEHREKETAGKKALGKPSSAQCRSLPTPNGRKMFGGEGKRAILSHHPSPTTYCSRMRPAILPQCLNKLAITILLYQSRDVAGQVSTFKGCCGPSWLKDI